MARLHGGCSGRWWAVARAVGVVSIALGIGSCEGSTEPVGSGGSSPAPGVPSGNETPSGGGVASEQEPRSGPPDATATAGATRSPAPSGLVKSGGAGEGADAGDGNAAPPEVPRDPARIEKDLHAALAAANRRYRGGAAFRIEGGDVIAVQLGEAKIKDLSPLRGLPLRFLDAANNPVEDLSPLEGMPLTLLGLEKTGVKDLSALAGMKLEELWLNGTGVSDISVLKGMPLKKLSLVGTAVEDLSALAGMPLESLWLNDAPVEKVDALKGLPLVSLTLKGTRVDSIAIVEQLPRLERLHIAETPVTDLSLLEGTALTRLVFTPERITAGLDVVRALPTLQELGTRFGEGESDLQPPALFWRAREAGGAK